jgi:hypothetical protein
VLCIAPIRIVLSVQKHSSLALHIGHRESHSLSVFPSTNRANLLMVEADSLRAKFNAQAAAMRTLRGMANGAMGGGGEAGTATMLPGTPRATASAVEAFMSRVGGGGDAR